MCVCVGGGVLCGFFLFVGVCVCGMDFVNPPFKFKILQRTLCCQTSRVI